MSTGALDFAKHPSTRKGRLVLVAGLALLVAAMANYRYRSVALQDMEATLQASKQSVASNTEQTAEAEDVALASARRQLALNWEPLFSAIESAVTEDTALLSLDPDPARSTVRLSLEAKDNDAMLSYVDGLSRQPGMRNVVLASQETLIEHPQMPVRFTVEAAWQ